MPREVAAVVQELYRTAAQTRTDFGGNVKDASSYYAELMTFVTRVVSAKADIKSKALLDIGCGSGWSSFGFAMLGYLTTGIDLNQHAFEPPQTKNLTLHEGSALALPFRDSSFDVVTSYQCLEHVPQPKIALEEMVRVCKPCGIICIVGPNLVSPLLPLKFLLRELLGRSLIFKRNPHTPHHPYGNTAYEYLGSFARTTRLLLQKLINHNVTFNMRDPDTVPPFHGDNDACYLCNPTDLVRFFREHNLTLLQNGRHGRPPLSHLFAGGTWLAAQKCEK